MAVVLELRTKPGRVDRVGVPLSMRTPKLLETYGFRYLPGTPSEGDPIPATAPVLDKAERSIITADGMLLMLQDDGSYAVAGRARGADAVMPATMGGAVATDKDGKARLDWSALKLKAAPSWVDVASVGRVLPWTFDMDPGPAGVTVTVTAPKTGSVVSVSVNIPGEQPVVGARLLWRVTA